jgi:hypothetical protein
MMAPRAEARGRQNVRRSPPLKIMRSPRASARGTTRLCGAVVLALGTAVGVAQVPPPAVDSVAPGTREMAALLAERAAAIKPTDLWFNVNDARVEMLAKEISLPGPPREVMRRRYAHAAELLYAGQYPEAIAQAERLLHDVDAGGPDGAAEAHINILMLQAQAYLRWGEEQNCADASGHNRDSCLLPIRGQGIHRRREGSMKAVETLERVLRIDPGSLRARWLLNIAHMTLGSYPEGVPRDLLIPPSAFAAEYPLKPFVNVAREVGLDIYGRSGGAVLEDFDNDGLLDLMTSATGFQDQTQVFRNDGTGKFVNRTAASGLTGLTGGLNMIQADYDNDGLVDVIVLRGAWMGAAGRFPLSLLRNLGGFRFEDVTKKAGLLRFHPTQTAVWWDYNGDGWLDLFVGNESWAGDLNPCELFRNNRDGTFTEIARDVGLDVLGYVKGVVSGDYDNDGRPDLYLSVIESRNLLFHNDGPQPGGKWRFTNVASAAGVEEPSFSFPAMFFDYDNDGWLDLFVAAYKGGAEDVAADYLGLPTPVDRGRLYHNERNGRFRDVTKEAGLWTVMMVMGLNYGDLDNDGWLDFYAGTGNPDFSTLVPKRMFRNDGGKRFQDVTTAGNFGHLQKGHGIAFGDVDNDGDQDIFEEMGGAYQADRAFSVLYENPGNANGRIGLDLEGDASNRRAIGARLKISLQTPRGPRVLHRTVGSGGSFGASPLRQEIGIGEATAVASVEVRWPGSGTVQTFRGVTPGGSYRLREGADRPEPVDRPRIMLSRTPASHSHDSGVGRGL